MKLKRIGVLLAFVIIFCGGGVYAVKDNEYILGVIDNYEIRPLWNNISVISPSISSEGNLLYPEVYVKAKSTSSSISVTMYIEKYYSGKWTSITSWKFNGTGNVFQSKSYRGRTGNYYRTRVEVNIDGEKAISTSVSCKI